MHCRLCASIKAIPELFPVKSTEVEIKIREILQLNFPVGDVLPQLICFECHAKVLTLHDFKQQVHGAQEILQQIYGPSPICNTEVPTNNLCTTSSNSDAKPKRAKPKKKQIQEESLTEHDEDDDGFPVKEEPIDIEWADDQLISKKRRQTGAIKNNVSYEGQKKNRAKLMQFLRKDCDFYKTFDSSFDAETFIDFQRCWKFRGSILTEKRRTKYFSCNRTNNCGDQVCNAGVKIILEIRTGKVKMYHIDEHICGFDEYKKKLDAKTKRGFVRVTNRNRKCTFFRIFDSTTEAENFIRSENCWKSKGCVLRGKFRTKYLQCNRKNSRGEENCAAGIKYKVDIHSDSVTMFRVDDHTCEYIEPKLTGMNKNMINIIEKIYRNEDRTEAEAADKLKNWTHYKIFNSSSEVENFIKAEKYWKKLRTVIHGKGPIKYYRCNRKNARGKETCKAGIKIQLNVRKDSVVMFRKEEHSCEMVEPIYKVMDENIKSAIEEMMCIIGTTANDITDDTTEDVAEHYRKWYQFKCFTCKFESVNFIKEEGCWCFEKSIPGEQGESVFFRCKSTVNGRHCCKAGVKLKFFDFTNSAVLLRADQHTCNNSTKTDANDSLTPRVPLPIEFFVEINNWLQILGADPVNLDTAFVLNHEVNEYKTDEGMVFRFVISSKRLLENIVQTIEPVLHIDPTNKFLWQGFSIFIIGTTDRDRIFHSVAIAVCANEDAADFEFIFGSLKAAVSNTFGIILKPKVLVTDNSPGVKQGFQAVFGDVPVRMCWTQMRNNLVDRLISGDETSIMEDILKDIDFLQISEDKNTFERSCDLFFQKWAGEGQFIEYFLQEYINNNPGWYEGFCMGTPSTNDAMHSARNELKDEIRDIIIRRQRKKKLILNRICKFFIDFVQKYSQEYASGRLQYFNAVTINDQTWAKALEWVKLNKDIHTIDEIQKVFIIPSSKSITLDINKLSVVSENFNDHVTIKSSFHKLCFPRNDQDWQCGRCSCSKFLKTYICKHLLGMALRFKLTNAPDLLMS